MKPTVLIVLDGFGERSSRQDNAVKLAHTPHLNSFLKEYPHTYIEASGKAVGLPEGLMGNSEVGHLTMGAGRIALLGLTRIYQAIEDGSFFTNPVLNEAIDVVKKNDSKLHLMGLVSDGAVHSHQDHLYALLKLAKLKGVKEVYIHAFTDGRDTSPKMADVFMTQLEEKIKEIGVGKVATISGRFYAMDRDKRWDRIQKAYESMVDGKCFLASSTHEAIISAFNRGETDEFISPTLIDPEGLIAHKDAVIFFNFRSDRAREMTQALTQSSFDGFVRNHFLDLGSFVCFSEYDENFNLPVAFPKIEIKETFADLLSAKGFTQLKIAETEKYAHVTFFFNGGIEAPKKGEDRILIPSPKEVPTYDLKPEMSARLITQKLCEAILQKDYDFILCNFANPDMVGHTGHLEAATKAVEVVDDCLGEVFKAVFAKQGRMIITADHGNCEKMKDEKGIPHTAHTTELVPFILIDPQYKNYASLDLLEEGGGLPDVVPTILQLMNIVKPSVMTGRSLLKRL